MKKFEMSLLKYPKAIHLGAAMVTAAVTAATLGAASAAQTPNKAAPRAKPVEVALLKKTPASKQRVSRKSIPTRVSSKSRIAAATPRLGTLQTAAISERAGSAGQEALQSSQSSATRISMPVTNTSTVAAPKPGPKMIPLDNFKFATNLYYYGSSIASPLDSRVPDFYHGYQDRESGAVSAEVHFSFGYKFHPNWTFSLNPQFEIAPSYNQGEGGGDHENKFMKPIASYFKLAVGQILAYKNFKWNGDFRLHPGITDDLRGTPMYFRSNQNFMFSLSKSTTFAFYNSLRYYVRTDTSLQKGWAGYNAGESPNAPYTFRFTFSPTIEQQLTDKVGAAISYNVDNRLASDANVFDATSYDHEPDGPYVEAGLSLDFIENFNVSPYIDVYTRRPNFYGTRWGMNLSYTIL